MPTLDPQEILMEANAIFEEWYQKPGDGIAPSHQQSLNLLAYLTAAHCQMQSKGMGRAWPEVAPAVADVLRVAFELGRASAD